MAEWLYFCVQVGYVKFYRMDDKPPLKGAWSGSYDLFQIFGATNISWTTEGSYQILHTGKICEVLSPE